MNSKYFIKSIILFRMEAKYKSETFHMIESFNNTKQAFRSVSSTKTNKVKQVRGQNGSTWDAIHLTKFLSKSNYSNKQWNNTFRSDNNPSIHKRSISTLNHFFRTTKDNRNASKIGYTKINPLITTSQTKKLKQQTLKKLLEQPISARLPSTMFHQGQFKFEANSVKFNQTDPLTLQHLQTKTPSNFQKERMKRLIQKRHPHGIIGIDHPEDQNPTFYSKYVSDNTRIRIQPNSKKTHLIDRDWKTKGRSPQLKRNEKKRDRNCLSQLRKFSNDNIHGYNILNNREL